MPRNCYITYNYPDVFSWRLRPIENIRFSLLTIRQTSENNMGPSMLLVLSVVAVFSVTAGLRCYQCFDSNYSANATDSCSNPGENVTSVECLTPLFPETFKSMCVSAITDRGGEQGEARRAIFRGCREVNRNASETCTDYDFMNITGTVCYCSTDNCISEIGGGTR